MDQECFKNDQYALIGLMEDMPFFYAWSNKMIYGETDNPRIPVMAAVPDLHRGTFKRLINPNMGRVLSSNSLKTATAKCLLEILLKINESPLLNETHGPVALDLETITRLENDGFKIPEHPEFPDEPLFVTPALIAKTANDLWKMIGQPKKPPIEPPPNGKTSEWYLEWIRENFPTQQQMEKAKQPMTPEDQKLLEELLQKLKDRAEHPDPPPLSPEDQMVMDHIISQQVKDAVDQGGLPPGSIKGEVESRIQALKARVDWRKKVRHFPKSKGHLKPFQSFGRMNKYGGIPRTMYEPGADITFVIDVSGSMSDSAIGQGFGEAEEASKYTRVRVICLDYGTEIDPANVHENFKKRPDHTYGFKGRGGTDMCMAFDYLKAKKIKTDAVVVFTDGYTPFPNKARRMNIPTLWVVTTTSIKVPPEAGDFVHLDEGFSGTPNGYKV